MSRSLQNAGENRRKVERNDRGKEGRRRRRDRETKHILLLELAPGSSIAYLSTGQRVLEA
eukprot:197508-Rhodomonas_salina.3